MSPVLFLLVAWGALDVVFVSTVSLLSARAARHRPRSGERILHLVRVDETSTPSPQR